MTRLVQSFKHPDSCNCNSLISISIKVVVATGSTPRKLQSPWCDLENVFVLRTPSDANVIAEVAKDGEAVVIGSSFIGMEVAAFLSGKAKKVTVIGGGSVPFEKSLGTEVGEYFKAMHVSKGVEFAMPDSIADVVGREGKLSEVVLKSGRTLPADVLVCGIGVTPNTDFLKGSGVELTERGCVKVDEMMSTSVGNVFAAGDVVSYPLFLEGGRSVNIGHYQLSMSLGRNAALNLLGKEIPIRSVPFFWTQMFGKSLR